MNMQTDEQLLKLSKEQQLADLYKAYSQLDHPFSDYSKNKIVVGRGDVNTPLLFLAEGPGRIEDITGRPFTGPSGKVVDELFSAIGISREQVYMTSVVKCRLPNNRCPTKLEIAIEKRLIVDQELKIVQPKIVCCLGEVGLRAMAGVNAKISDFRGKFSTRDGFTFFTTYHPAHLLRSRKAKPLVIEDLKKVMEFLQQNGFPLRR